MSVGNFPEWAHAVMGQARHDRMRFQINMLIIQHKESGLWILSACGWLTTCFSPAAGAIRPAWGKCISVQSVGAKARTLIGQGSLHAGMARFPVSLSRLITKLLWG